MEANSAKVELEVQIWQLDQKIILPDTAFIHISFHNKDNDFVEAITLGANELHKALMTYNEERKKRFNLSDKEQ